MKEQIAHDTYTIIFWFNYEIISFICFFNFFLDSKKKKKKEKKKSKKHHGCAELINGSVNSNKTVSDVKIHMDDNEQYNTNM